MKARLLCALPWRYIKPCKIRCDFFFLGGGLIVSLQGQITSLTNWPRVKRLSLAFRSVSLPHGGLTGMLSAFHSYSLMKIISNRLLSLSLLVFSVFCFIYLFIFVLLLDSHRLKRLWNWICKWWKLPWCKEIFFFWSIFFSCCFGHEDFLFNMHNI